MTDVLTEGHKEFLHGLFTTALEGGIGYWSVASAYIWAKPDKVVSHFAPEADLDKFYAIIHPAEIGEWGVWDKDDRDTQPLRIDLEVMNRGARMMNWYVQGFVNGQGRHMTADQIKPWPRDHYYWQYVESYITLGERGDYDAGVADMVVQFGLFGTVVYG